MPTILTPAALKTFFDANPAKYKTGNVLADGYLPTDQLGTLLGTAVGTVPNPSPQPTVTKPITTQALAQAAPTTLAAIAAAADFAANMEPIAARIRTGDNANIGIWATGLLLAGKMPQAEHDAVEALCVATQPDPNWPATVPGPSDLQANFLNGSGGPAQSVLHSDINLALGRSS